MRTPCPTTSPRVAQRQWTGRQSARVDGAAWRPREEEYGNIYDHIAADFIYPNGVHMSSRCRQFRGQGIAQNVSACAFDYNPSVSPQLGILTMRIRLQSALFGGANETVSLYHAVHVNNAP